ncbi:hypothetical protein RUM43_007495 [Polyplax serrata]|uniref:DUF229 domain containing protein n=1 Tax=Polyplax serrata TaxID=468196 RepID=A0AAN8S5I7_POLSC
MRSSLKFTHYVPQDDREALLKQINEFITNGNKKVEHEGQACRVPVLDVNASEILELIKPVPPVICNSTRDWVEIHGSTAKIMNWAKEKYGDIKCAFTDIIRETDHKQHQGMTTSTRTEFNLENSDVVIAHCISEQGIVWHKVMTGIRSDQNIFDRSGWSKVPKDSLKLNVLIFGFDSLSHNMWKRHLKKTYKFATETLKGIALNGYNIVGDGTPQALIPILTGKTELELPDTRKRMGKQASYVNVYPFIWNDFQRNGYVTSWTEDLAQIGTFTYRLRGFKEQPVDHYMRTFYMEATPDFKHHKQFCYGGMTRFQLVIDFVRNTYDVYRDRPKFVFAFHSEYSHESNNWAGNADEDTFKMLQDFHRNGYLNNTLLILMSDHGARFADIRNTQQGKQEERLPGFIFVFPGWFEKKYPEAHANFVKNADRLTTPFDIHETLQDVLHFRGAGFGNSKMRGISLFKEVPASRTCQNAGIEPHWCSCLDWETVPVVDPTVQKAVDYLLIFLNGYTKTYRNVCAKMKIDQILWSAKLIPNKFMLKFKSNSDRDGFVGEMSAHTKVLIEIYQVKVSFSPGNMIFEASIRHNTEDDKFIVSEREISRINKYKDMTHCIEDKDILHQLRKFCYCV